MSARRISIRKIIQTLVTVVVVTGCALAMISADRQQSRRTVRDVQIRVISPGGVKFLTEDAVRNKLFTARHLDPNKQIVSRLDERTMEAILRTNPWVKEAQIYTDAERVMHITLTQRVPVVRLFEEGGNSYYLDADLKTMPLSGQYTHYTPVVTGVPNLRNDSISMNVKGTIVGLVQQIGSTPFWNAQISQIDMRTDGGFELIPIIGKQRIIIGDTARVGEKLENLFAFYRQVHNKIGWDKYRTIDLRYEGQVVASPALAWKAPVDRAISTMSWLDAIMQSAPATVDAPGGDAAAFPDSSATAGKAEQSAVRVSPPKPAAVAAPRPVPTAIAKTGKPEKPPRKLVNAAAKRTVAAPASAVKPKPKLPPGATSKKTVAPAGKNTTRHNQNTKSNAATNR